ncbi:MAG: hypothetical protein QM708_10565 [Propioniciclava sp.]|uniref:hypothetical protein n=1 Tax=Propioniciclava sp. TaxID=2038686 RepID=UPI0039E59E94
MTDETFVFRDRVYEVRVSPAEDLRTAVVTVTLDGRFEWSLTAPGWRAVSLGASGEIGYLWSARQLAVLPHAAEAELQVISVDEDLLSVFRVDEGWLLVCETSIRLLVDEVETARVELGDVVEVARWEGGVLQVRDAAGEILELRVDGARLIA